MNEEDAAKLFHALSNPDRLRVIRALVVAGPEGLSAGEIGAAVNASPSRASFHLATLADAGFLTRRRNARSLVYAVDFNRIGGLLGFMVHDCCKGHPTIEACCTGAASSD
ncbi:MAG: metalloregulator ArsR/SmtB family transcription factor [Pseudomonadota bacterium]